MLFALPIYYNLLQLRRKKKDMNKFNNINRYRIKRRQVNNIDRIAISEIIRFSFFSITTIKGEQKDRRFI